MDNKDKNEIFSYTYSAREQEELKRIRQKYLPAEDKMEKLRQLDAGVTKKASAAALIFGILGALTMGIGMCCTMVWQGVWFIPGIVIGIAGIILVSLAYPVYNRTIRKEREKIAPEVLQLTDELMK